MRELDRQLEQDERVAGGGGEQTLPRRPRRPARSASPAAPVRPRSRAARAPPAGTARRRRQAGTRRDQERELLADQPPRCERERVGGRPVEPVRVVESDQRSAPRRRAPRAATAPLRRPPGRRARPARARAPRPRAWRLRTGQARKPVEHGPEQLVQAREGKLELALDAGRGQDPHVAGQTDGFFEQRRLAEAGVADQDQRCTSPAPRLVEQSRDAPQNPSRPTSTPRNADSERGSGKYRRAARPTKRFARARRASGCPACGRCCARWYSTVFGLRNMAAAISLFVFPSATSMAMCSSCGVSSGVWLASRPDPLAGRPQLGRRPRLPRRAATAAKASCARPELSARLALLAAADAGARRMRAASAPARAESSEPLVQRQGPAEGLVERVVGREQAVAARANGQRPRAVARVWQPPRTARSQVRASSGRARQRVRLDQIRDEGTMPGSTTVLAGPSAVQSGSSSTIASSDGRRPSASRRGPGGRRPPGRCPPLLATRSALLRRGACRHPPVRARHGRARALRRRCRRLRTFRSPRRAGSPRRPLPLPGRAELECAVASQTRRYARRFRAARRRSASASDAPSSAYHSSQR